ncbi:MAG: hypothetical protein ACREDZ_05825 [Kiloniellales bacterium]
MRKALRLIGAALGWLLILAALALLARDLLAYINSGNFAAMPLGELWYRVNRFSLNLLQAGIERNISQWLWQDVLAPSLLWPASLVFGVLGLLLAYLCRPRQGPRRRFASRP